MEGKKTEQTEKGVSGFVPAKTGYDEIVKSIKDAPLTYLPAILITAVKTCIDRGVFTSGEALIKTVRNVVEKHKS